MTGVLTAGGERTSTTDSVSGRVSANQIVWDPTLLSQHKSQKLLTRAGELQLDSTSNQLITRTSQAYFNVLVALETLAAAEAQEAALKKQFDFASKRLEVGLAPITDMHEARAQYEAARANTCLLYTSRCV